MKLQRMVSICIVSIIFISVYGLSQANEKKKELQANTPLLIGLPPILTVLPINGLERPESIVRDPLTGYWYLSNVNGSPDHADNNGFITRLNSDLTLDRLHWVAGGTPGLRLDAPKGLTIVDRHLYIADITRIVSIHLDSGEREREVNLKDFGAVFLNDLVYAHGLLFVTDTQSDRIYNFQTNMLRPRIFIDKGVIDGPNGIFYHSKTDDFTVVSWNNGNIHQVTRNLTAPLFASGTALGTRNLDGVQLDKDGNWYLSDWKEGCIYKITPDKKKHTLVSGLEGPADFALDEERQRIVIPMMNANLLGVMPMKYAPTTAAVKP